jgi:hypothetical protein
VCRRANRRVMVSANRYARSETNLSNQTSSSTSHRDAVPRNSRLRWDELEHNHHQQCSARPTGRRGVRLHLQADPKDRTDLGAGLPDVGVRRGHRGSRGKPRPNFRMRKAADQPPVWRRAPSRPCCSEAVRREHPNVLATRSDLPSPARSLKTLPEPSVGSPMLRCEPVHHRRECGPFP